MVVENDAFTLDVKRALKGRPICVLNTVEGNDAFTLDVRRAVLGRPLCVLPMVVENDAFTLDVRRALKGLPICVLNTVVGNDALILNVRKVLERRALYVLNTVEAHDAQTASHGPTHEAVKRAMTATVRPVSNISFQRTHEARSCIPIPRRSVFVIRSMNSLKDSCMINHYTQGIAIAPCGDGLITENS
jgi:uncharacterized membrane protein